MRATSIKAAGTNGFSGEAAFFLYDSMGFPLDLTELMAREAGLTVDAEGFAQERKRAPTSSKSATHPFVAFCPRAGILILPARSHTFGCRSRRGANRPPKLRSAWRG